MKLQRRAPKRLIDQCWDIAEKSSDSTGFVSVRSLAECCRCQVVPRPLLVEAAITRKVDPDNSWVALINNEIHPFADEDFELENAVSPLPIRTRNTLAHEIAHAVAWNHLGHDFSCGGRLDLRLSYIEKSVETVSPLLLIPKSALISRLLAIPNNREALKFLHGIHFHFAVSTWVFFGVLLLFNKYHRAQFLLFDGLLDSLWGVAEIEGKRRFRVSSSRLLSNFFKGRPHPVTAVLLGSGRSEWLIERTEERNNSIICVAKSCAYDDGATPINFEFAHLPLRKGQFILFRIPGTA